MNKLNAAARGVGRMHHLWVGTVSDRIWRMRPGEGAERPVKSVSFDERKRLVTITVAADTSKALGAATATMAKNLLFGGSVDYDVKVVREKPNKVAS